MPEQYSNYLKPEWAPPAELFGPVWTILYIIIVISFGAVILAVTQKKLPAKVLIPFALNLFFNLIFTPIQFGLENNLLASIDVILVVATLIWAMVSIWKYVHFRWVALVNIPYLLWGSFATILQISITVLN